MKNTGKVQIRYLTVYKHFSQRQHSRNILVPQIRLIGKWIREAGFDVEDRIKIIVSKKCLLILLDNEEKQEEL